MCTTMIITRGASADGSMMVAHSDDDELSDQRIIYVPSQEHEPGMLREVFHVHNRYPRIVSKQRGPNYDTPGYPTTKPIGHIPQATHTYAYFDGNYGIMNEHNLMMGECTNAANYQPEAVTAREAEKSGKHIRLLLYFCRPNSPWRPGRDEGPSLVWPRCFLYYLLYAVSIQGLEPALGLSDREPPGVRQKNGMVGV